MVDTLTMNTKSSELNEYAAHAALSDTALARLPTFSHGVQGPSGRRGVDPAKVRAAIAAGQLETLRKLGL